MAHAMNVRMPDELYELLREYAHRKRIYQNTVVCAALGAYLESAITDEQWELAHDNS
jgi:predicted DNA-binding protein